MSKTETTAPLKKVAYNDAVAESKKYFDGDELAATVWVSKYALKDSFGNIYESSPRQMHERIAAEIERIERKYPNPMSKEEVFELLDHFRYVIPQGGPMTGIGNNLQVASLSNCFVIGHKHPADSYGGIFRIDEEQVQLMKRRGGVGHDLSHIRPTGSPVLNSALTSTGIVPFMERYSNSTREVAQDGRRGALMLTLSIKHPDAERFIDAKVDTGKVTGANVSIKIDDEFMRAAIEGKPYHQQFPINSPAPLYQQDIDARKLWEKIIHNAWKSAEPGVLFWDTIIRESVPDCYADEGFVTVSTNPCGEIPLCPYDSCRLLAINLFSYVDKPFTKEASFNFERFKSHVNKAMRMMDDIIDLELEKVELIIAKIEADPEDEDIRSVELNLWKKIRTMATKGRRTGLGITAEGDMLAALGLRYGSDEAIDFAVEVQKTLALAAYRASVTMAGERGAFPIYSTEKERNNPMIARIREADPELYAEMAEKGRRNIALLTIAPTGTTSLMSQTTSGIEPVFRTVYKRRRKINPSDVDTHVDYVDETGEKFQEYNVYHHNFVKWLEANGYDTSKLATISDAELDRWVAASPYHGATANDIDWVAKVKMQGAIQKWVDHSISVTVNLPNNVSEELVAQVYRTAWESGCKGVTVYRDGCRDGVLLDKNSQKKSRCEEHPGQVLKRPKSIPADIVRFKNGSEDWIAFVGLQDGRPYEIFTGKIEEDAMYIPRKITKGNIIKVREADGTKRYDFQYTDRYGYTNTIGGISRLFNEEFWNYAKLISGVLRHGMPIEKTVSLIESLHLDSESINTWKTGVCRALKQYIVDGTKTKGKCPSCGQENMAYQNGCITCMSCGYSKCG
ncbi:MULTISPECIES: adenosylcobalamin-dependent ribonucleoside-diphosphate reductase [unclassified Alistipes]|jgi:ribonucleoside-diphosphate reductase alpha chain|uniref:adenosylcobalamin-dependent ribonucleoside-diphosphate reductase n=1 Tax=unclassified Alistipes TaxID=2608932 RepID=UPI000B383004|nr:MULTISPECIES: adenosylcobalamin-dependent ribonucleoside-diphosphate reductase [unclassified Alistipes]OUO23422.1 ribonucleoside-diphosphate reductase, adenosylcobalamin-dependent [Alistipes sp. An31A]HIV33297.1 adenosylcobalamin-dependent ribonucleoside-diphosphate reductase [Candidatus Alistipes excrementigallinarum]